MPGETWENTQQLGELKDADEPLKRSLLEMVGAARFELATS